MQIHKVDYKEDVASDWRLFIDSKKAWLKAVLSQNTRKLSIRAIHKAILKKHTQLHETDNQKDSLYCICIKHLWQSEVSSSPSCFAEGLNKP